MTYRSFHPVPLLCALLALAGCGTMHHYIPPIPPEPGEIVGSIGVSWSSSRFSTIALQGNVYVGMTGRDLLGIGFNNFIVPTSFSYAHYAALGDQRYLNLQLHASLLGPDPRYETDLGYGARRGGLGHAAKLGLGYVGTPRLEIFGDANAAPTFSLVPVFGYDLYYKGFTAGLLTQPGLTRRLVRAIKGGGHGGDPDGRYAPVVIPRDRIVSIESRGSGIFGIPDDREWVIRLADSDLVYLSRRAPGYQECLFCSTNMQYRDIYTASSGHRNYTVVRGSAWDARGVTVEGPVMELDMAEILRRYEETGVLRIEEDPDVLERTLDRITPGLDDLSIGVGYEMSGE